MIANYFMLQAKILRRHIQDAGFPAFVIFPAIIGLYILLYSFVNLYPTWGAYLLILINFQYLFSLSDFKRSDFLKTVFPKTIYYKIRLLENIFISVGTMLLLTLSGNYLLALVLSALCILFLFTSTSSIWKRSIPTPFTKKPFEFTIGFRKCWLLLCVLYMLSIIAFTVDNINLALFSMFCISLCCTVFYQDPEPLLIHWNQNRSPARFLRYKIWRGIIQLSTLIIPILLSLMVRYPAELYKGLIVWLFGLTLIPLIILFKYAVFPRKINLTEATILGLCLTFYPLIIALVPYYYFKAVHNLKSIV